MAHKLILHSLCARYARFFLYAVMTRETQGVAVTFPIQYHSRHPFPFYVFIIPGALVDVNKKHHRNNTIFR